MRHQRGISGGEHETTKGQKVATHLGLRGSHRRLPDLPVAGLLGFYESIGVLGPLRSQLFLRGDESFLRACEPLLQAVL